ncbi:forespore capture DNA-binding protein RefZ [Brevibacillus laterosporus]|uniref:Forespore capture DNA-binding protein RefZ n=1 Tax=Brevibacillus laterosporus TaxID=1465 RepID=A0AAP8Q9W0_BRELA|nr:forespore capture DNA-binding protein RefZ [Brevibacillus laterosporus]ATO48679.1 TetR family transcriptional regulator [Brevibacillus laterosporus DSM 25]AYB41291.1 TetR/AcrR family transcriptional regulator [Brevibacillus laterosporus]MBG9773328.1 transcriptional regulator [Brevibacillus laterosporus]MBG9796579.1 transcriptional regulator [Brevibacillus laterosporus]MBG9800868.1 transcriptional regulator [Brevibacillus laterosporus]
MRTEQHNTKERILVAAASLFYSQGYDRTTVRQIAEKAQVNVALISYHFQGKQGVLEKLISHYYDHFFKIVQEQWEKEKPQDSMGQLEKIVRLFVFYQHEHALVTRLIQRELSVESMLAREVMTVYIHQLKHRFASVIEDGIQTGEFRSVSVDAVLMNLSSILTYPYLNPQIVREVYYLEPGSADFCEWLVTSSVQFLRSLLVHTGLNEKQVGKGVVQP